MGNSSPLRLVLSPREQQVLGSFLRQHLSDKPASDDDSNQRVSATRDSFNLAAFRSASRVYVATSLSLKVIGTILDKLAKRSQAKSGVAKPRKPLVASPTRLALSLSSLLFFHRVLFRLFSTLRLQLLHEKVRSIQKRYPRVYAALTSQVAPAIGASLSGLALGICPSDQLRLTIAIYVACRALETLYTVLDARGLMRRNPFGSWAIFALAQGQLLHAFVFDRDCFPEAYSSLILANTPEYIQRRPANLSSKVIWPTSNQIVDALAEMARLRWPPFISPILRPNNINTLPATINPVISPITSRAHVALQNLSCALIHPAQTSCFMAYLRQNLIAFPQIAKFFTLYYGAMSLLKIKQFIRMPVQSFNRLSKQILQTTMAISGAIGASWGTICLFQAIMPRKMLPQSRFFLGGLIGGTFAVFDRTSAGHANAMYAARSSVDSLWKVGVKRRWWRPIKGGDVYLFVAALATINVCFDIGGDKIRKDRVMSLLKVLRGDIELGLQRQPQRSNSTIKDEKHE